MLFLSGLKIARKRYQIIINNLILTFYVLLCLPVAVIHILKLQKDALLFRATLLSARIFLIVILLIMFKLNMNGIDNSIKKIYSMLDATRRRKIRSRSVYFIYFFIIITVLHFAVKMAARFRDDFPDTFEIIIDYEAIESSFRHDLLSNLQYPYSVATNLLIYLIHNVVIIFFYFYLYLLYELARSLINYAEVTYEPVRLCRLTIGDIQNLRMFNRLYINTLTESNNIFGFIPFIFISELLIDVITRVSSGIMNPSQPEALFDIVHLITSPMMVVIMMVLSGRVTEEFKLVKMKMIKLTEPRVHLTKFDLELEYIRLHIDLSTSQNVNVLAWNIFIVDKKLLFSLLETSVPLIIMIVSTFGNLNPICNT